jgi:hypothetical protein
MASINPIIFALIAACLYMGSDVIVQSFKDAKDTASSLLFGFEGEVSR